MTFRSLAPVFPVRDIDAAARHYRALGFDVRPYEGDAPYAFADRDGVSLHLAQVDRLNPKRNTTAVYAYVVDADTLFEEWRDAEIECHLHAPRDTEYGLREGACVDPDGNLIRFGSEIRATAV